VTYHVLGHMIGYVVYQVTYSLFGHMGSDHLMLEHVSLVSQDHVQVLLQGLLVGLST
jgi:hypothetical protein